MNPRVAPITAGRLDQWLVAHGHAGSRTAAQAMIMAGLVTVDGRSAEKSGQRVTEEMRIEVRRPLGYASRGGLKLAHALEAFKIDVTGLVAVDLGASTGGFTDCLLRAGAARVYAVDVGRGQLSWRLRNDPRVVPLEGVNARYLTPAHVGGPCDFLTADLAFISLRLVWAAIAGLLDEAGAAVVLVKPQFEAGREKVTRGGVVRDPSVHRQVLGAVLDSARVAELVPLAVSPSPILGPAGNVEFLAHLCRGSHAGMAPNALDAAVAQAHAALGPRRHP